jgi:tRNA 2-thiocytidine biosynthesis protein TtcA
MERVKEKIHLNGVVKYVYKQMGKAILDYKMLEDKDRILVGVSGGIDSLALLKLFQVRRKKIPINFDLVVCFIDTNFIKVDKDVLINYLQSCGVEYVVKELRVDENDINCFWCSWNRRKLLFETAREYKCNKVALGHNLDDTVETVLLNLFYIGEISTMKPNVDLFGGDVKIIRPLCYVDKKHIAEFASKFSFPDTQYECRYGKDSRRQFVKKLIREAEKDCSFVKKNIFRALKKVKQDYLL